MPAHLVESGPGYTMTAACCLRETGGPTTLTMGAVAEGEYLRRSGSTLVGGSPAGGGGATGTTTVNFGAFPGSTDTSVAVTGQASITAGSIVRATKRLVATADHSADEHFVEELDIEAGNISAGTGFTIYAKTRNRRLHGQWTVAWSWS